MAKRQSLKAGVLRAFRGARKGLRALTRPVWRRGILQAVLPAFEHAWLLSGADYSTVIDIGAHKGQFAIFARGRWPGADIICFEPLLGPRTRLKRLFRNDKAVHILPYAVGSESGTETIHISQRDDSSSLLPIGKMQSLIFPGTEETDQATVEVRTLDSVLPEFLLRRPVLMKIDVQGYELHVLRGAPAILAAIDSILVECSYLRLYDGQPLFEEVSGFLMARGFSKADARTSARTAEGQAVQTDVLFHRVRSRLEGV